MLKKLKEVWDGYLRRISTARHRIELAFENVRPLHSTPSWVGQADKQSKVNGTDCTLKGGIIAQGPTRWAAPMVFALKKDCSPEFASTTKNVVL